MIKVIGLGPGNPDYIPPVAREAILNAEMVIGATRNLAVIGANCVMMIDLKAGFDLVGQYIQEHQEESIAVVVSGDAGFYSLLDFVKRHAREENIQVIPGISSLQYMYSRLAKGYEDSRLVSLHGRTTDLAELIEDRTPLGILTDKDQNNRYIAEQLMEHGAGDAVIHVGERLSYPDERITRLTVKEGTTFEADPLSVVIVTYENNE